MNNPKESGNLNWSPAEAINWVSRSVSQRDSNPDPTLDELITEERAMVESLKGDPNVPTHMEVLRILESLPPEQKGNKVSEMMKGWGVEYKYGPNK